MNLFPLTTPPPCPPRIGPSIDCRSSHCSPSILFAWVASGRPIHRPHIIENVNLLKALQMIEIPLSIFSMDDSTGKLMDFDSVINATNAINNVGVLMDFGCWQSSSLIASVRVRCAARTHAHRINFSASESTTMRPPADFDELLINVRMLYRSVPVPGRALLPRQVQMDRSRGTDAHAKFPGIRISGGGQHICGCWNRVHVSGRVIGCQPEVLLSLTGGGGRQWWSHYRTMKNSDFPLTFHIILA